jgi:hypothetical protein
MVNKKLEKRICFIKPGRTPREKNMWTSVKRLLVLALIINLVPGCTTLRPVPLEPANLRETVKPGDRIRVTTLEGQTKEFTVEEVTRDTLKGTKDQVAVSDLTLVEKKESSPGKTAAVAVGVTVAVLLGLVLAAALQGPTMSSWNSTGG